MAVLDTLVAQFPRSFLQGAVLVLAVTFAFFVGYFVYLANQPKLVHLGPFGVVGSAIDDTWLKRIESMTSATFELSLQSLLSTIDSLKDEDIDQSLVMWRRSLSLFERHRPTPDELRAPHAKLLSAGAELYFEKSRAIPGRKSVTDVHTAKLADLEEALQYARRAVKIREEDSTDTFEYAEALNTKARILSAIAKIHSGSAIGSPDLADTLSKLKGAIVTLQSKANGTTNVFSKLALLQASLADIYWEHQNTEAITELKAPVPDPVKASHKAIQLYRQAEEHNRVLGESLTLVRRIEEKLDMEAGNQNREETKSLNRDMEAILKNALSTSKNADRPYKADVLMALARVYGPLHEDFKTVLNESCELWRQEKDYDSLREARGLLSRAGTSEEGKENACRSEF